MTTTYNVGNPGPDLEHAQKYGGVKLVKGSPPSPLDNWISNGNAYINQRYKTYTDSFPFKKTSYYHTNEWQHKHRQYNNRANEYWLLARKVEYVG